MDQSVGEGRRHTYRNDTPLRVSSTEREAMQSGFHRREFRGS